MRITRSQLRRIIRESLEDEQQMYVQKVQKIFPTDANQAIILADTAGIGDTPKVMAMKGARNVIDDFLHDWDMEDDEEFPITPSYPYGESVDANAAQDRREDKNGVRTVKLHSYLSHSLPSTKDARPIIRMWVRAIYGYQKGPPYRKSEVRAAEDLAAWAGIDTPTTASKRAKK
jgi:hypothetical protein